MIQKKRWYRLMLSEQGGKKELHLFRYTSPNSGSGAWEELGKEGWLPMDFSQHWNVLEGYLTDWVPLKEMLNELSERKENEILDKLLKVEV